MPMIIRAPTPVTPPMRLIDRIESALGAVWGFKGTKVETQVILEKNVYRVGETIRVRILCDNKNSSKDVKSFKVKLKRKADLHGSLKSGKPSKIHESDY